MHRLFLTLTLLSGILGTWVNLRNNCGRSLSITSGWNVVANLGPGASQGRGCGGGQNPNYMITGDGLWAEFTCESWGKDWFDLSVFRGYGGTPMQLSGPCGTLNCGSPGCPDAYDYSADNTKTHACGSGSGFTVTWCPGGGCVDEETPIVYADGSEKPAGEVKVGDLLMGADGKPGIVSMILRHDAIERDMISINKGRPFATGDHPWINPITNKSIVHDVDAARGSGLLYTYDEIVPGQTQMITYRNGIFQNEVIKSIDTVRRKVPVVYFIISGASQTRSFISGNIVSGTEVRSDIESLAGVVIMKEAVLAVQDDIYKLYKSIQSKYNGSYPTVESFSNDFVPEWKRHVQNTSDIMEEQFSHLISGVDHTVQWKNLILPGLKMEKHRLDMSDTVVRMLYPPVHLHWMNKVHPDHAKPARNAIVKMLKKFIKNIKI